MAGAVFNRATEQAQRSFRAEELDTARRRLGRVSRVDVPHESLAPTGHQPLWPPPRARSSRARASRHQSLRPNCARARQHRFKNLSGYLRTRLAFVHLAVLPLVDLGALNGLRQVSPICPYLSVGAHLRSTPRQLRQLRLDGPGLWRRHEKFCEDQWPVLKVALKTRSRLWKGVLETARMCLSAALRAPETVNFGSSSSCSSMPRGTPLCTSMEIIVS